MIQYLNRLKGKKGFTLVELIVVFAVIAVLVAGLSFSLLGNSAEKVMSANANAEAFLTAAQLTFTRAQLTERSIVEYADTDTKFIEYKNGINITNDKYLFLEAKFEQRGIVGAHIANTFNALMARPDITSTGTTTALESYLAQNLDKYLSDSYDGYFYAAVDENFKVFYTHFCRSRLPVYSGNMTDFVDSMMIVDSRVTGNHEIIGSCSDHDPKMTNTDPGKYVFDLPTTAYPGYSKYLA